MVKVMRAVYTKRRKLCGVGINDADYAVEPRINGARVLCPYYKTWRNIITRCYSSSAKHKHPTYKDCYVCDEWLVFSNFKKWMEKQDWEGKHLDKDLLYPNNKIYSPNTCVFVDRVTNNFITDAAASRGEYPIGVHWSTLERKFKAQCNDPFTGKRGHLGSFLDPDSAHMAWAKRKYELAIKLASKQSDSRVAEAIINRFKFEDE